MADPTYRQGALEDAKLNLVRRLGESARAVAERARRQAPGAGGPAVPAYPQLYGISCVERSYPVRLAAVQEIGAGGDQAFVALKDRLGPQLAGGPPDPMPDDGEALECWWRESVARAWLAPMLVGSVTDRTPTGADELPGQQRQARDNLRQWRGLVAGPDRDRAEQGLYLSVEVALAQGFKHAANRRRRHAEARAYLAEQARAMLRGAGFWFTRLTLVHALCLWIPPSTGWTALDRRAQQLVADVPLLLNLAERGGPIQREQRLRRTDRNRLPPCLAGDRSPLDASRTIGMARSSDPGSNCKDGCPVELCPYPPKGEQSYRVELSEAFCHRQQALMNGTGVRRRAAPWQGALPGELRRFWKQMAQRTHPAVEHEPEPELDGRRRRRY